MKKKGSLKGMLAGLILIGLFLAIYVSFFNPTLFKNIEKKFKNMLRLPDQDPTNTEQQAYAGRSESLNAFSKLATNLNDITTTSNLKNGDLCFGTMPILSTNFFDNKYATQLEKIGSDTVVKLLQYQADKANSYPNAYKDVDAWKLIDSKRIKETSPCIIKDKFAVEFNDFVLQNDKKDVDESKFTPVEVSKITLYNSGNELYVGSIGSQKSNQAYEFYQGDNVNKRIIMKLNVSGKTYLCLIPTKGDGFFNSGCSGVNDRFIDDDCLDYRSSWPYSKTYLPIRLQENLKDYVCKGFEDSIKNIEVK